MIKIYGVPRTSAGRCYLMLEEVGKPYETMPLDMREKREHKSEDYLRLNPNGKVPCLIDGDFVIWESLAINHYLAEKYKPELLGRTPETRGHIQQWSLWALLELQPPMVEILIQMMFTPEDKKNPEVVARAREKIPLALRILDNQLKGRAYLLGSDITLADFNVGSVVNIAVGLKIPMEDFKNVGAWMNKLRERPSFKKFLESRV